MTAGRNLMFSRNKLTDLDLAFWREISYLPGRDILIVSLAAGQRYDFLLKGIGIIGYFWAA
jgi:hypothetical protein